MRVYDNKGRLIVDFKLHGDKHESGGVDEVSLAASQVTSGRFGMPRMPDGTSGQVLTAQGAGVAPAYVAPPPGVPSGLIAMWHGLIANIPSGWVICDGNNGTPNLLAKFVEGVATAGTNPGATGGSTDKTTSGHQHDTNFRGSGLGSGEFMKGTAPFGTGASISLSRYTAGDSVSYSGPAVLTSSKTDTITDIRPPYYDIAFIMKT